MKFDRRTLLVGAGAGAGLVVAYLAWPRGERPRFRPRRGDALLASGIAIGRDGRVTIAVPQVETGQGIWTGLAQLAADELGAAWENVAVTPASLTSDWPNALSSQEGWLDDVPTWRRWRIDDASMRITAGSTSMRAMALPMRQIGAAARSLLVAEAADRWSVAAAECDTADGFVQHEGKRLPFADLAEGAGRRPLTETPALRARTGTLAGRPLPRLDAAPKAKGTLRFASDVRLPGMLFASLRTAPGGSVEVASAPPRGVRFERGDGWLAAIAADWWSAEQALANAQVRTTGRAGGDDAAIAAALDHALARGDVAAMREVGDVDAAFAGLRPLAADYAAAAMLHHDLDPPSATARLADGLLEIWAATQAPALARQQAALATNVSADGTLLYPLPVGGQGGRALENDLVPIVATLAKRVGKPVQLTLSRTEQLRTDPVRAPLKARLMARTMPDGSIAALKLRLAGGDGTGAAMNRMFGGEGAGFRANALPILPYAVPNLRVEAVAADLPCRIGYHRGELFAPLTFFLESFVDELARINGRDPLSSRIALLAGNPRLARCLVRATALGGWDGGGPGSSMGLATLQAYGSFIAVVANASLGPGGAPLVSRMVAVVDCGTVANPGLVRQQIEGGMIASLAQAAAPAPTFLHGRPQAPLDSAAPRLANTPEILVEVLASRAPPGGVNGLGYAAAPAAVANALAAGTGRRLRSLPFAPMA